VTADQPGLRAGDAGRADAPRARTRDALAAVAPAWFAPAALALAAAAALVLPGHPAGLGLALAGTGLCALVAAAAPRSDAFAAACWLAAAVLAAVPVLRAATWVVVLSLLAALALAAVAAAAARTWRELGAALLTAAAGLVPGPVAVLVLVARSAGRSGWARLGPAARGVLLAAVLLAVFVPLLGAADAVFAELLDGALSWGVTFDRPLARLGAGLLALAVGGGLLLAAAARRDLPPRPPAGRLGRTEWTIALGALDLTFAAFVAVQLTTLFGGHDHVLRTAGLTYAEYARRGFFELEAVAALTLAVVAGAARWARRTTRGDDRLARALLGVLCVLTLIVLASALRRLGLYEEAYGATRLRLLVGVQLAWLGAVFVLLLIAGAAREGARLPRAVVAVSAATALGFAAGNPDARIAERNVDRFVATGRLDAAHLGRLSADAAPAITRLPADRAGCVQWRLRAALGASDGWAGANVARARARRLLASAGPARC
jgi:hypothetical protein